MALIVSTPYAPVTRPTVRFTDTPPGALTKVSVLLPLLLPEIDSGAPSVPPPPPSNVSLPPAPPLRAIAVDEPVRKSLKREPIRLWM